MLLLPQGIFLSIFCYYWFIKNIQRENSEKSWKNSWLARGRDPWTAGPRDRCVSMGPRFSRLFWSVNPWQEVCREVYCESNFSIIENVIYNLGSGGCKFDNADLSFMWFYNKVTIAWLKIVILLTNNCGHNP